MNNGRFKRITAATLTVLFFSQVTAFSGEITGINSNNGVYNINPSAIINGSDIGYRKYINFNLDKGETANLNFKFGDADISTFVNLVDNRININGLVNSVRNGNFYNGRAIFVSPNGMIVGASGVLNVGSLGVTTPTKEAYEYYKANPNANIEGLYSTNSNAAITINGKVIATNDVRLNSGTVVVAKDAGVLAGTGNNLLIDGNNPADVLFNNLVNTDNIHSASNFDNRNGNITISSTVGTNIIGEIQNLGLGNTKISNTGNDGIILSGDLKNHNGNTNFENTSGKIEITGNLKNENGETKFVNTGDGGINFIGQVFSTGNITIDNAGSNGININSESTIDSDNDIAMINTGSNGINIQGLTTAGKDINIDNKNSNVVIGDETENNNYVTAGNDINIVVVDGSILNYGVEKTLLNATGNLNMDVTDGTIGLGVQQEACTGSGCTGIGPKADGSRDFTKSVNANIKGKVNAKTTNTKAATKPEDLVINYAAIDSDMNIDSIKADGRVILTVDDDFGVDNNGPRYNMVNVTTDKSNANVEGWGISLISNGNIGTKDNKLTFNQTKAPEYAMDVLANGDINIKALDDEKNQVNKVCTMISREGNIDAEFGGNTTIDNLTAEGDINIVTRGTNLTINNLGHIEDPSVVPNDYFGPRHDGYEFDQGYDKDDYKSEVLPNNVTLAALDINKFTRPDGEDVDGYYGYADSTVRVNNAVLDNGKLDITADEIYANGVHVNFGKDGFTKEVDPSTNPVIGASEIPTGHAVRPDDVEGIGHDEHERNYYYHEGDGDGTFDGVDSNVDDDDNIVDDTPLAIPDDGPVTPPPVIPPEPDPDPDVPVVEPTTPKTPPTVDADGSVTYIQRKNLDNAIDSIDKRQYMRFNISDISKPVLMEKSNNGVDKLIDISRGGIAISHNNKVRTGDVLPVHIRYKDLDINTNVKVVSATTSRAGAEFVGLDKNVANQLLYLSVLLESDNNLLATRFSR